MKNLIIVGAGNMARDVLQIVKEVNHVEPKFQVKGFIADWGLDIKALTNGEFDIIGTIEKWQPKESEVFVCAIADPKGRETVVSKLENRGARFINLIHPTARLNDYCKIGKGVILYAYSSVDSNAKIGNYVVLHRTPIAHDVNIDDFTTVNSLCSILGGVKIGRRAFIGAHVTIIQDKTIGNDAYVGAGSVVIRRVAEGTKVFGNPAKRLDF